MYREATVADADALGALLHRCDPVLSAEANADYVPDCLAQDGSWVLLGERGGEPIGVVSFEPSTGRREEIAGDDAAYLRMLFVDPPDWGRGVGVELMSQAVTAMARGGYERAYLWTAVRNARARRFYEREGWSPDGGERFHETWKQMLRYVREELQQ